MTLTDIQELITQKLGSGAVLGQETAGMQQALIIEPAYIANVCLELRNNPATYFDFLSCLTGVDYGVEDGRFGVIYHLASIPYKTQLTLKISREYGRDIEVLPSFLSLSSVYRTADWHEREAYDLVGIFFENHPDLRRILMPDDWEGHPLRRDYQNAEYYKGIKID